MTNAKLYPQLHKIIRSLWLDNYGAMYATFVKPEKEWIFRQTSHSLLKLESLAQRLTDDEMIETFTSGEHREQEELTKRLKLRPLSNWLIEVFDGELSKDFLIPIKD